MEEGGAVDTKEQKVELVGASSESVPISGSGKVRAPVRMGDEVLSKVRSRMSDAMAEGVSLTEAAPSAAAPEQVFLNLENVRGLEDATSLRIYVGLPQGADPNDHPERLAGSVALFGVSDASDPDAEHAGEGLTFVVDVTKIVQELHLQDELDANRLPVHIVPFKHVPEEAEISIGRISLFRQGR